MSPRVINQIVNFIFDNLILLIFFASVIIPLLRRAGKSQTPNAQKPRQPTTPPTTANTPRQVGGSRAETPSSDFQKRLEEARKRVQEAMEDSGQPQTKPVQASSARRPQTPGPVLSTELLPTETHDRGLLSDASFKEYDLSGDDARSEHPLFKADHSSTFLPSESVTSSPVVTRTSADFFAPEQAPLEVVRRKQKSAKLKSGKLLEFDERSISKGLIWHYILSEPHARKRRKLFPHQS